MKVSVVVCTYNRVKFIRQCLQHLTNQTLDKASYEVIVVNNNCTDDTESVVNKFISENLSTNLRQVFETNQGLSYARNRGIKEAKTDLVFYIDDDGIAEQTLLEDIVTYFDDHPQSVGAGGKVIPIYETEEPKWLSYHLRMFVTLVDHGEESFKCFGKKYPAGCNMTYRKSILEDVGMFNENIKWRTDDKYIYQEVVKVNDNVYYLPNLKVGHHIDKERLEDANFERLATLLGSEDRIKTETGDGSLTLKLLEFIVKLGAAIVLSIPFLLRGQFIKAKYLIKFRLFALRGLIMKSNSL